jgi:hypothetical protein
MLKAYLTQMAQNMAYMAAHLLGLDGIQEGSLDLNGMD